MTDKQVRIERDFLGSIEIDDRSYYGIQTLRAVENFPITGYSIHPELIRALGMIKKASALANRKTGRLENGIAAAICIASDEVIEGQLTSQFIVDPIQGGAGTSINMNANEVIANRALELLGHQKGRYSIISPNTHINMSQSTNDVFPTAIHLAVLRLLDGVIEELEGLVGAFSSKAMEFDDVIKIGRTHLQDAVPIRLGQEFGAYANVLRRDLNRIRRTREPLLFVNLGATAVGTGLNADPDYVRLSIKHLAEISGYPLETVDHLVDGTQNTDGYTEVSAALKICMVNISKISNDLRLMASGPRAGLNELNLPPRQPGSSIMPGKVNPVIPEVMNQIAFQVIGNDHTITLASEAGQMELNVMEPVLVFNLLQSLSIMKNGFHVFKNYCIEGITPNEDRMRENVNQSIGLITAINPHIGYEQSAEIAREALVTGKPIREICLDRNILDAVVLEQVLDPFQMTGAKS
ncbi:Aspartate ammonia-lyase [Bhargavaea cecembensis DSE10]|uniref:Aspartate ammonia-lyase n=1 Tax=Bhargavaea cecembensis DSE10 TaxID=1235279 RepID=M7P7W5_9BACL|nr:aspartate ammonia-lyase [Bhargavaea cecembensis]EMR06609.1 Aspartate ammonia-lyase [Bhargavaea cecembensis DSE10]